MAAEVSIKITAQDNASPQIRQVGAAFTQTKSAAVEFFKSLVGFAALENVLSSAVNGVKSLAGSLIEISSANERYKTTLQTLLGSQAAANQKFAELNEFARKTPFQIDGLMQSFIMMKSYGLEPTIDTMRVLGGSTAALGGGAAKMEGIARALGQIATKGKLSAQEMMQLAEQGVPAYDILKQKLGITAKELENLGASGISANQAIQAILEGLNERFGGQMQKMQSTWQGVTEEIKSLWRDFVSMISEAGIFDKLKTHVMDIRDWLQKAFETGEVERWAASISSAIGTVIDAIKLFVSVVKTAIEHWDTLIIAMSAAAIAKATAAVASLTLSVAGLSTAAKATGAAMLAAFKPVLPALAAVLGYEGGKAIDKSLYRYANIDISGLNRLKEAQDWVSENQEFLNKRSEKYNTILNAQKSKAVETAGANELLKESYAKINEALGQFTEKVDSLNPAITEQEKAINSLYKEAERVFKEIDKLKLPSWARQELKSKIQVEFDRGQSFIKERAYQDELKKTFEIQKEGALKALEEEKKAAQSRLEGLQEYRNSLMQVYDYAIEKANQYYSAAKQAGDISKEITEYLEGRKAKPMSAAEKIKAEKDAFTKALSDAMKTTDGALAQKAFEMGKAWLDKYAGHTSSIGFADMFDTSQVTRGLETLASYMNGIKTNTEQAGNAWMKYADEQASAMQTVDLWIKYIEGSIINLDARVNQVREIKIDTSGAMANIQSLIQQIQYLNSISSSGAQTERSSSIGSSNISKFMNTSSFQWSSYAVGTPYVPKTGPAILHKGEAVLNEREADRYRKGQMQGNQTINFAPTINVLGTGNPETLARQIVKPLRDELKRLGALN